MTGPEKRRLALAGVVIVISLAIGILLPEDERVLALLGLLVTAPVAVASAAGLAVGLRRGVFETMDGASRASAPARYWASAAIFALLALFTGLLALASLVQFLEAL